MKPNFFLSLFDLLSNLFINSVIMLAICFIGLFFILIIPILKK
ncbi:MAG: hypothetical protein RL755_61 [Pseudomonadota bacterium]|jgi:hypothetical protein